MNGREHPLRAARVAQHWSVQTLAEKSGLSRRTIIRAEQGHGLNPDSIQLLCKCFGTSSEDLGLTRRQQALPKSQEISSPNVGIDDMNRREFLRMLSTAGTLLAVPPVEGEIDWERMDYFADRTHGLDQETVDQYAALNAHLWRVFASSRSKSATFHMVRSQLDVLIRNLVRSHGPAMHQRLSEIAGNLFQLAGEIFFDGNHYADAAQCYSSAAIASKEASAFDLWACAITRHAFIGLYEREFRKAVPMLELADRLAQKGDSTLSTRHWVNAVRAQAFAGIGELEACQRSAGVAEQVSQLNGRVHNGGWLRFDGSRLAEERGICFVELRRPDLAEAALTEALGQSLSMRRRGIVLTDLAMVGVQRRDPDQVHSYATAALDIARHTASGVVGRKLQGLQHHLGAFVADTHIRQLNEQIESQTRYAR